MGDIIPSAREEVFMKGIANVLQGNDSGVSIAPSSREEVFMNGIANVLQGNESGVDIAPSSRTEYFLNEILEAASGGGAVLIDKNISANGTYNASSDNADGYKKVIASVPNSYAAGDEGKVVSNGALVAQTSATYTENDTYDTTLINSVTVNVSGGGGNPVAEEKDVNFIDYDGTIRYSYTAQEFAALDALPVNPDHTDEGLTAQGWNWTLTDAKNYVAAHGFLDVGQMYVTTSGDTEIDIELQGGRLSPYLGIAVNGTVTINWGDNSSDTITGASLSTQIRTLHNYLAPSRYTITIHVESGKFAFYGTSSYTLLNKDSGTLNNNLVYSSAVRKVRIGNNANIKSYGFYACYNLTAISIPSGITYSEGYVFQYCYSLKGVVLPSTQKDIAMYYFANCSALKRVAMPKGLQSLNASVFSDCYSLVSAAVPDTVTTNSDYGFQRCYSLTRAAPGNSVSISKGFYDTCRSLAKMVVPDFVTSVYGSVFSGCTGLGEVRFEESAPPAFASSNVFSNVASDCIICVTFSALAAYLTAANYPSKSTYTYLGFATYSNGATLPTQDSTEAYNVVWYASKADAIAQTNPITQGNGAEIYCRYTAA